MKLEKDRAGFAAGSGLKNYAPETPGWGKNDFPWYTIGNHGIVFQKLHLNARRISSQMARVRFEIEIRKNNNS
jgi:hypothetical protein